jgi:D-serine deaminase-like pyridoxal phosphate-dependent protein
VTELAVLPTPALLLDASRMRRNVARVGTIVAQLGVRFRPHVKTHKCVEVARLQVEGHAGGIMVSTLAEARVFAEHGFHDITYGVPVERGKFAEVVALAGSGVRLGVITDDAEVPSPLADAARAAGVTVDVWVKVDCGYHRCGVDPAGEALLSLVQRIGESSHLRFAGLLTHAGHAYHARGEALRSIATHERDVMVAAAERLRDAGVPVPAVSVGSTPTLTHVDHLRGVDEVRAGNCIFFDTTQATIGSSTLDDCVLSVLTAVVHRDRANGKVVLDAGAIALSKDRGAVDLDAGAGYGRVLDTAGTDTGLRVESLSQEHAMVRTNDTALLDRLAVGSRWRVLVNHSCLTAAQHDAYHVVEGDRVVDRWSIHRGW